MSEKHLKATFSWTRDVQKSLPLCHTPISTEEREGIAADPSLMIRKTVTASHLASVGETCSVNVDSLLNRCQSWCRPTGEQFLA
jgi:hypothetical protein